ASVDGSMYLFDGTQLQVVAQTGPDTYSLFDVSGVNSPSVNNVGDIVFLARAQGALGLGTDGVFSGPDPLRDRVAVVQPLDGTGTVSGYLALSPKAINDHGQVGLSTTLLTPSGTQSAT